MYRRLCGPNIINMFSGQVMTCSTLFENKLDILRGYCLGVNASQMLIHSVIRSELVRRITGQITLLHTLHLANRALRGNDQIELIGERVDNSPYLLYRNQWNS
jgi:hypothetical protein